MAQESGLSQEQENAVKQLVLEKTKGILEQADRRGERPKDPRDDPNYKRWLSGIKHPFSGPEGDDGPDDGYGPLNCDRAHLASIGRKLANSQEMADFIAFSEKNSRTMKVKSLFGRRALTFDSSVHKAAGVTGISDTRETLATDYLQTIYELPTRASRMRDLIPIFPTMAGAIQFVRMTGYSNQAGIVPENPDPSSATALSQSAITVELDVEQIKSIGHFIPVPAQFLDDVDQMSLTLEHQLPAGVLDQEDAQFLLGDGIGNNILGLMNQPLMQSLNWSDGDPYDNRGDAVLNAIVKAWVAYYIPDGVVMTPGDWAKIVKAKDDQQRYQIPQVHQIGLPSGLWGLPVVRTVAQSTGKFLVGSFRSACSGWERQEAYVYIAREHSDWALKNLLAVICQERVGLIVPRPESFVKGTWDVAPSTSG